MKIPTPRFTGSEIGPALLILSKPEIRAAEILPESTRFPTRDGIVQGRAGDIAITAYGGERYPIPKDIFFGTYAVLGQVGPELIAQRLVHVRRAWKVLNDGAEFDYGAGRGTVAVPRGGWVYQSDDTDFGVVHPEVQRSSHVEVGLEQGIASTDWRTRCARCNRLLHMLPPLLALLALSAFMASSATEAPHVLARLLVGIELVLLLGGAAVVLAMRHQCWALKASVQTALELGREFQCAAQLLGQQTSADFVGMALWRAAQLPSQPADTDEAALLHLLKTAIARRIRLLGDALKHAHLWETRASRITLAAFLAVLAGNISLLTDSGAYTLVVEFAVCWLPALVAGIHGVGLRRRTAERTAAMRSFADELRFSQVRLFENEARPGTGRQAVLAVICRSVATYSQHQLRLAMSTEAALPV